MPSQSGHLCASYALNPFSQLLFTSVLKFLLFTYVPVCVCVRVFVCVRSYARECPRRPDEDIEALGAGVTGVDGFFFGVPAHRE